MPGDELKRRKCQLSRDRDDCKQSPQELPELSGIATQVTETFGVGWNRVYDAVKQAVSWGLLHRDPDNIGAIE
jgi:hypothetical protein